MSKSETRADKDIETHTVSEILQHDFTEHTVRRWNGSRAGLPWTLYQGPAQEALAFIPDESVDCIITSPPYFWLRDYKSDGQIGLEDSVDAYVVAITDVLYEAQRILKKSGLLFLNLGDTYYSGKGKSHGTDKKSSKRRFGLRAVDKSGGLGIGLQRKSIIGVPWRVAIKMCQQSWVLRAPIIWHRANCLPEPVKDRPSRSYEYIFMFAKSRFYAFNKEALTAHGTIEDVWSIPARPKSNGRLDTAPYPDELVEKCLAIGCPNHGVVLDPFAGSGTTLRVALDKGHSGIGVELNPEFCQYIMKSLCGK